MLLQFRGDGETFACEQGCDPIRGPGALAGFIDSRQGLERDGVGDGIGERAARKS